MKLSQRIYLSTTQRLMIYRPEWLASLPVSPLFLGLPSLSVVWLESQLRFFLRWLTLSKIPCRKNDVCQTTEWGSTHGMSHYKWPLTDLTVWLQRVKAAFWCWGILVSPWGVQGRAGGPTLQEGCFLQRRVGDAPSQCLVKAEAREPAWHRQHFCCTCKYLIFQVCKDVFEEGCLEVAGGGARYLEQSAARVRPVMRESCKSKVCIFVLFSVA